jgi:hypothetical protein
MTGFVAKGRDLATKALTMVMTENVIGGSEELALSVSVARTDWFDSA